MIQLVDRDTGLPVPSKEVALAGASIHHEAIRRVNGENIMGDDIDVKPRTDLVSLDCLITL